MNVTMSSDADLTAQVRVLIMAITVFTLLLAAASVILIGLFVCKKLPSIVAERKESKRQDPKKARRSTRSRSRPTAVVVVDKETKKKVRPPGTAHRSSPASAATRKTFPLPPVVDTRRARSAACAIAATSQPDSLESTISVESPIPAVTQPTKRVICSNEDDDGNGDPHMAVEAASGVPMSEQQQTSQKRAVVIRDRSDVEFGSQGPKPKRVKLLESNTRTDAQQRAKTCNYEQILSKQQCARPGLDKKFAVRVDLNR